MSDRIQMVFELVDRMSGGIKRIVNAMRGLTFNSVQKSLGGFFDRLQGLPAGAMRVLGAMVDELRPLGKAIAFAFEPITELAHRAFAAIATRAGPVVAAVAARFTSLASAIGARLAPIGSAVAERFRSVVSGAQSAMTPIKGIAQRALSTAGGEVRGVLDSVVSRLRPVGTKIAGIFTGIGARLKPVGVELGKLIGKVAAPLGKAVQNVAGKVSSGLGSLVSAAGPLLASGAGAIAAAAAAAAAVVGGLALAGGAYVLSARIFKEDTLTAFEAILGSKSEAQSVMAMATKFAAKTPFETGQVMAMTQSLVTRGFKGADLETAMKGVGDVGALLGTEKMESVINALGKMRAGGKLTGESLEMLSDAGINSKLVLGSLASQLGKTEEEVRAMLSAGKITDAQGFKAAMDAIAKGLSGGELGGAMDKKSKTLSGLLSTLKSVPEELVFAANLDGAMEPIKNFIKLITDNLTTDSPLGQRIIGLLELVGTSVGKAFGRIDGSAIQNFLTATLNLLEPLVRAGAAFIDGFAQGLAPLAPIFERLAKSSNDMSAMQSMVNGFVIFGKVVGWVAAMLLAVPITLMEIVRWGVETFGKLTEAVSEFWDELKKLIGFDVEPKAVKTVAKAGSSPVSNAVGLSGPAANALNPSPSLFGGSAAPSPMQPAPSPFATGVGAAIQPASIQPAAASGPTPRAEPTKKETNVTFTVQPGAIVIQTNGENAEQAGKQAADSFSSEVGQWLKGMAAELGR